MKAKLTPGYADCIFGCRLKKNLQRICSASGNLVPMLHAVGEIYEDRGKTRNKKSQSAYWTARDDVLHCIPWGEAASTDVWLLPDESGARFTKFGTAARFDISHQAGSYMPDLKTMVKPSK